MRFRDARSYRGTPNELADSLANQVADQVADQASGLRRLLPMTAGIEHRLIAVVRCGASSCESGWIAQATLDREDSLVQVLERDWRWMQGSDESRSHRPRTSFSIPSSLDARFEKWTCAAFSQDSASTRCVSRCDAIVLGFRPEPESLIEAYRVAKQWLKMKGQSPIGLVVESNGPITTDRRATDHSVTGRSVTGRDWAARLQSVAAQHLRQPLYYLGDARWWEELNEASGGACTERENEIASQVDLDGWAKFDEDPLRSECAALPVSSSWAVEPELGNRSDAATGATNEMAPASGAHGLFEARLGDGGAERINDSPRTEREWRRDSDPKRTESIRSAYELRRDHRDSIERRFLSPVSSRHSRAIDGDDLTDSRLDRRKRLKKWLELVRLFDKVSLVAARKRR